jgi:hypothetical protein
MSSLVGRIAWLARRNAVVIMDEGIVHRFRSVRGRAGRDISIAEAVGSRAITSLFPIEPALFVSVCADAETIRSRMRLRDGRLVTATSQGLARTDSRSLRDIDEILAAYPNAALMLAHNESPDDIPRLATEIADRVQAILDDRSTPTVQRRA